MRQHHFYDDLHLTIPEGVYVPREDTDLAADWITDTIDGGRFADIGTGSGLLALVAAQRGADVIATDRNPAAVETTRRNAADNGLDITVQEGDMFGPVEGRFDTITFNAPYLPGDREGRTEEELAWYGGEDGRELIRRFLDGLDQHLTDDGTALLVLSSLTGIEETEDLIADRGLQSQRDRDRKVSWERIQLLTVSKF